MGDLSVASGSCLSGPPCPAHPGPLLPAGCGERKEMAGRDVHSPTILSWKPKFSLGEAGEASKDTVWMLS